MLPCKVRKSWLGDPGLATLLLVQLHYQARSSSTRIVLLTTPLIIDLCGQTIMLGCSRGWQRGVREELGVFASCILLLVRRAHSHPHCCASVCR